MRLETCLRMMYISKFRWALGFETLCREVSDSINWRRLCRMAWESRPDSTTLLKIIRRVGPEAVTELTYSSGELPRVARSAPNGSERPWARVPREHS